MAIVQKKDTSGTIGKILTRSLGSLINCINLVVQLLSHGQLFATPWTPASQASLSFTISWCLLKLISIQSVMPSSHLILCHPLFLLLQYFPASGSFLMSWLFVSGGQSIGVSSFSLSPSNEYLGLMSFRIDWFALSAVQGTCKSLLQHHSSKASILQLSVFFMVQCLHPYMITGKTIALTRWTFVGKVMSLLFNTLPRLVKGPSSHSYGFSSSYVWM